MEHVNWSAIGVIVTILTLVWRLGAMTRGITARMDLADATNQRLEKAINRLHRSLATLWHGQRAIRQRLADVEEAAGLVPRNPANGDERRLRADGAHRASGKRGPTHD